MARDYVCLYHSYLDAIQALGDAERGRLLTAMLEYSLTGATGHLGGNERFIFPIVKAQIDRDKAKYEETCRRRSESGKLGGRPEKQDKAIAFSESKKSQGKGKGEGKGKEESKDNVCYANNARGAFDVFWDAYPKKVGKAQAKKSFAKVKVPLQTLLSAIEVQKQSTQWQKDGGQYIPNPATWLNQGRWEDELQCDTTSQKDPLLEMIERGDFRDNGGNREDPFDLA